MSRTDLNDVVRYRLITTGVLRLMGIWLIAVQVVPAVRDGVSNWSMYSQRSQQQSGFPSVVYLDYGIYFWSNLGKAAVLLLIALFLIVFARRLARRIIPLTSGRCPACDYDLGSTPPARCPECGLDLSPLLPPPVQSPPADSQ